LNEKEFNFSFVEKQIRKKSFGVLTTINKNGTPHTTGILYGVSPTSSKFALYSLTSKNYKKVRNIKRDPRVSFLIPFPHYYIRFAPSSTVTFQGIPMVLYFFLKQAVITWYQEKISSI